jgi:four helix bundle protein
LRIKICRKEAKESAYWLRLILNTNAKENVLNGEGLLDEAVQLKKIFSSILQKSQ